VVTRLPASLFFQVERLQMCLVKRSGFLSPAPWDLQGIRWPWRKSQYRHQTGRVALQCARG
jgi:hypothetical protein